MCRGVRCSTPDSPRRVGHRSGSACGAGHSLRFALCEQRRVEWARCKPHVGPEPLSSSVISFQANWNQMADGGLIVFRQSSSDVWC